MLGCAVAGARAPAFCLCVALTLQAVYQGLCETMGFALGPARPLCPRPYRVHTFCEALAAQMR
jgi:hypothetical protein